MRKVFSDFSCFYGRPACRRVENIGNNVAQHKHRATPVTRSNVPLRCSLLSAAIGNWSVDDPYLHDTRSPPSIKNVFLCDPFILERTKT